MEGLNNTLQISMRSIVAKVSLPYTTAMEYFTSYESRQKRPFQSSSAREGGTLYFAYGSNLHLTQMATRCPASIFKGKAVLPGYRWQINQRGVANVVESADESVEGLLYLVNPRDERALDRSEGVSKHFYQRHTHHVDYEPHEKYSGLKSSRVAHLLSQEVSLQEAGDLKSSSHRTTPPDDGDAMVTDGPDDGGGGGSGGRDPGPKRKVKALVYVSENYTTDGLIREEYILRMKKAASDAIALGVSKAFVDRYMVPFFSGDKTMPPPSSGSTTSKPRGSESASTATAGGGRNNRAEMSKTTTTTTTTPHTINLDALKQANRTPHTPSGLSFPADLLSGITATRSKSIPGTIYIISISEQEDGTTTTTTTSPTTFTTIFSSSFSSSSSSSSSSPLTNTRTHIAETTPDLELANELAIRHFRALCVAAFPEIVARGFEGCARADGAGSWPCVFDWELHGGGGGGGGGSHVRLGAAVPELRRHITVRVEPCKVWESC